MNLELKRFADLDELSNAAAKEVSELIRSVVAKKGKFSLVLSGGSTPKGLYRLLATTHRESVPWGSVSVFFGDERYVPHTDARSNYLMARETLLDHIPIPSANVHPIPTDFSNPSDAAAAYESVLSAKIPGEGNSFDLVLLGMGGEGHTASLFPFTPSLDEKSKWVVPSDVPPVPHKRITLTYAVLNRSSAVYFLISGHDKREALKEVLSDAADYHKYPAKGIAPVNGKLVWWVDSGAMNG